MKYCVVISGLLVSSLAGCSDPGTAPVAKTEPTTTAPAAAAAVVPTARALVSSQPVSTEGAVGLNQDCNIEGVDGRLFETAALEVARTGVHEFTGWIVNAPAGAIPKNLKLVVNGVAETSGVWTSEAVTMIERKGVAETRGYPAELANSGFSFKVDISALPVGKYHVFVMAADEKGLMTCDPGRQIELKN